MKKLILTVTIVSIIAISFTSCTEEELINPSDETSIIKLDSDDEEDESNPPKAGG